jgi:hypothetical protein
MKGNRIGGSNTESISKGELLVFRELEQLVRAHAKIIGFLFSAWGAESSSKACRPR